MAFVADVGNGPGTGNAIVKWDFDGDGKPDSEGKEASWAFTSGGDHKVVAWVEDGVNHQVKKVTTTVKLGGAGGGK